LGKLLFKVGVIHTEKGRGLQARAL
jgi:hypothetical protein